MIKINKFSLLRRGTFGIHYEGVEPVEKEQGTIIENFKKDNDVPIPEKLRDTINTLKLHFLRVTKHWDYALEDFVSGTRFTDQKSEYPDYQRAAEIYDITHITGLSFKGGNIVITGTILYPTGKVIVINTYNIAGENDYENYQALYEDAYAVIKAVEEYVTSKKLEMAKGKNYLIDLFPDDTERISNISDEEAEKEMIRRLEEKGNIVISKKDSDIDSETDQQETMVETIEEVESELEGLEVESIEQGKYEFNSF